jgi:indolepyruvate ferredoxin oxidoreductase
MAGHLEGKGIAVLDMTGLAQKGGSVYTHVRIAQKPEDIHAVRIAAGEANVVLGCDMIVSTSDEAIAKMQVGKTRGVINSDVATTSEFTKNPDLHIPVTEMQGVLKEAMGEHAGKSAVEFVDASALTAALMGDAIFTNPFVMGYAWQRGLIPLSGASIMRAIELNAQAVEKNKQAFDWGRRAAVDLNSVQKMATPPEAKPESQRMSQTIDEMVARRKKYLTGYQDGAYAERFAALVAKVQCLEAEKTPGKKALSVAVARYYFKLMAYKDEYEVARLYADSDFVQRIAQQFEGDYKLIFHMAPPIMSDLDAVTGEAKKKTFGPWMMRAFAILAKFKGLRGTTFDIFGYTAERKMERQLIADYEKTLDELMGKLSADNYDLAVDIASVPEFIRGFGHVKQQHFLEAKKRERELMAKFRNPVPGVSAEIRIKVAA